MYDNPSEYNNRIEPRIDLGNGYMYFMDKDHPLSSKIGRVLMHRHVVSVQIGRWLSSIEVVHHKDRNRSNNDINNLTLFKNSSEHAKHHQNDIPMIECYQCCKMFKPEQNGRRKYCSLECSHKSARRTYITKEELQKLVWKMPLIKIAKKFAISDVAVGKWCRRLGVQKPPRGYWIKSARSLIG